MGEEARGLRRGGWGATKKRWRTSCGRWRRRWQSIVEASRRRRRGLGEAGQTVVALLQEMGRALRGGSGALRRSGGRRRCASGERVRAAEADGAGEDLLVLEGCVLARARLEEALERTAEVDGRNGGVAKAVGSAARSWDAAGRRQGRGGAGRPGGRAWRRRAGSGWTGSLEGSEREARVASRQADVQGRLEARRAAVRRRLRVLRSAGRARRSATGGALHVAEHEASYEDFVALVVRLASRPAAGSASAAAAPPCLPAPAARAPRARVRWRQATRGRGGTREEGAGLGGGEVGVPGTAHAAVAHLLCGAAAALRRGAGGLGGPGGGQRWRRATWRGCARAWTSTSRITRLRWRRSASAPRVRIPGALFRSFKCPRCRRRGLIRCDAPWGATLLVGASRVGAGRGRAPRWCGGGGGGGGGAGREAGREAEMLERVLVARRRRRQRRD